jgi:hypothetical protein
MIRFGPYRLDAVQGLRRGQREVRLTPRSLAVLTLLAGQPGRVVTKEELFESVWQDVLVTVASPNWLSRPPATALAQCAAWPSGSTTQSPTVSSASQCLRPAGTPPQRRQR